MNNTNQDTFSVWPLMIDMLTSILIIFVLFTFFDNLLNPQELEQVIIDLKREAFVNEFDAEFSQEIDEQQVSRDRKFDYLRITFSDKILFTSASEELDQSGKELLAKLAPLIKQKSANDINRIEVDGHTDDIHLDKPNYPKNNWELSSARAISVVNFLEDISMPSHLFSANGFGPNEPLPLEELDPQLSISEVRSKNRRIEIKIYFSAQE